MTRMMDRSWIGSRARHFRRALVKRTCRKKAYPLPEIHRLAPSLLAGTSQTVLYPSAVCDTDGRSCRAMDLVRGKRLERSDH